jgi:hypothetical protein
MDELMGSISVEDASNGLRDDATVLSINVGHIATRCGTAPEARFARPSFGSIE